MRILLISILSILFSACSDDTFQKVERLAGFRVLALSASAPEVSLTGGNSTVSFFVVDGRPNPGTVTVSYDSCLDPGVSLGAAVSCQGVPGTQSGSTSFDTSTLTQHGDFYYGQLGTVSVTVPDLAGLNRGARSEVNGISYLLILRFDYGTGELRTFKRITATSRAEINSNPGAGSIEIGGGAASGNLREGQLLRLAGVSAPEDFPYINVDGSQEVRSEKQFVSWYTTSGEFDKPKASVGEVIKYTGEGKTGPELVVAVVRDERGGIAVAEVELP